MLKVFYLFSECAFDYNNAINQLIFNIISFHIHLMFSAYHSGTTSIIFLISKYFINLTQKGHHLCTQDVYKSS